MSTRKAGPYLVKFPYVATGIPHVFQVNCDVTGAPVVGADPTDVTLKTRNGSGVSLQVGANALWAVMRPLLHTGVIALTYELFKVHPTNGIHSFVSGGSLLSPNGSSAGAVLPAQQATLTFRTGAAHIMKLELLDVSITINTRAPLASGGVGETPAIKSYILSGANFTAGRDRAWPVVGLNEAFGQNEKTAKRRYR